MFSYALQLTGTNGRWIPTNVLLVLDILGHLLEIIGKYKELYDEKNLYKARD